MIRKEDVPQDTYWCIWQEGYDKGFSEGRVDGEGRGWQKGWRVLRERTEKFLQNTP